MKNPRRLLGLLALLLSFSLVAAACGDDDDTATDDSAADDSGEATEAPTEATEAADDSAATEAPTEAADDSAGDDSGEALSGTITVSGSSTVAPITSRTRELFNEIYPDVDITVDDPGTGDGFVAFCAGETDISDASRAIKDEEAAICAEAGIEYVELTVGIDGLAVIGNSAETLECLSFNDIYALVGPESTGFANWSDAQALATELGSTTTFPDASLDIFGPGEESGTYDSFVELVLGDIAEARAVPEEEIATRVDYNASADDNVIIQGIQGSESSFGWVGYAYAAEAADVSLFAVDNGESGCVEPTPETIASGEYPIARPLFIYVSKNKLADNPALASFVDFFVSTGLDTAVSEVGYVALDDAAKQATRDAWAAR